LHTTLMPTLAEIGENLYSNGVQTKVIPRDWESEMEASANKITLVGVNLEHNHTEFEQIMAYLTIEPGEKIMLEITSQKPDGSSISGLLGKQNIEKIDAETLRNNLLQGI